MSEALFAFMPFAVGFTGHRLLNDENALLSDLTKHFREISDAMPHCRPMLLTGLAEGADQIAAKAALSLGWELVAVLPFPADDEKHGEIGSLERERFNYWLERAKHRIDAGALMGLGPDATPEEHYAALGHYLVQFSHLLVAAWDGVANSAMGGTSDVLHGRMLLESPRATPGPLRDSWSLSLVVPAARAGGDTKAIGGWYASEAELKARSPTFTKAVQALAGFEKMNQVSGYLGRVEGASHLARFDTRFAAADRPAVVMISRRRWSWSWLFVLALIAVVAQGIYGDLGSWLPHGVGMLLLAVFLLSLASSALLIRANQAADRAAERDPWDLRLFSEVLRVLGAWREASYIPARPELTSLLGEQSHVPDWLVQAVRGFSITCRSQDGGGLERIRREWIQNQIHYFSAKFKRAARVERMRWLARRSLYAGAALALGKLICDFMGFDGIASDFLWFLATLLPALAGVIVILIDLFAQAGVTEAAKNLYDHFECLDRLVEITLRDSAVPHVPATDGERERFQALNESLGETGRLAVEEVCFFHKDAGKTRTMIDDFLS